MNEMMQNVRDIEATPDLLERALKLAGLVTRLFREAGWDLVVVAAQLLSFLRRDRICPVILISAGGR